MAEDYQTQINQINEKLDRVLSYVDEQRLKQERNQDLMADASIVGKDAWDTIVEELERADVEINVEDL